ncbi:MAG TPA: response regulator transcription factor [Vicinamibacterales bacterium]|jgi:DNA-binding NarL/FixJ family response regulator|nr:response regulator transcription factor [Vicinamibacterales bacterium]
MIRVLIVDDHPVVHDGLSAVINSEADVRVIGSAGSTADAARLIERDQPDVVLLDLNLPGEEGISSVERVLASVPSARVIVFTAYDVDEYVFGAMRAGAKGYVVKGSPASELIRAIRLVHAGESYLSPTIGAKFARQSSDSRKTAGLLTPRELAVLRLVAAGQSNRQIAASLEITERTVKFHVTAIFNKLGADNRAQAVALAGRRGLLPIE